MKLRCNSSRLRVGPGDLERLVGTGSGVEQTRFGPGRGGLGYKLAVAADKAGGRKLETTEARRHGE